MPKSAKAKKAALFEEKYKLINVSPKTLRRTIKKDHSTEEAAVGIPVRAWIRVVKRYFRNPVGVIALLVLLAILVMSIVIPMVTTISPDKPINVNGKVAHAAFFGTDAAGRDVWTRLWTGTRQSLEIALIVAGSETIIGIVLGSYIGFHAGGVLDKMLMTIEKFFRAVPALFWLIIFLFILPTGLWTMVGSLIFVGFLSSVASTRTLMKNAKDYKYIKSARVVGVGRLGRIYGHILPNILGWVFVNFAWRIPVVVFTVASLTFIGFTTDPSAITLGGMISDAKIHIDMWWLMISPVATLIVINISSKLVIRNLYIAYNFDRVGVQ